ncbi:unnamed protein product, partial [Rotaria sp. Silwood1]
NFPVFKQLQSFTLIRNSREMSIAFGVNRGMENKE